MDFDIYFQAHIRGVNMLRNIHVAFRKKIYRSIDELQKDLDLWMDHYNQEDQPTRNNLADRNGEGLSEPLVYNHFESYMPKENS
jgi:hypothetical protein